MNHWEWHTNADMLQNDEVVMCSQAGVGIYEGESRTEWQEGKLILSTHHLFFQTSDSHAQILRLPLETIVRSRHDICSKGRFAFSHAKITVPLPGDNVYVKFSFRRGGMEDFFEAMRKALREKWWLQKSNTTKKPILLSSSSEASLLPSSVKTTTTSSKQVTNSVNKDERSGGQQEPVFSITDKAGIAGLIRATGENAQLSETLKDIDDVMNNASALVASIRHLRQKQNNSEGITDEDGTAIESIEATLGLGTLVRAPASGTTHSQFHKELALEMHAWMTHVKNEHIFGSMPLVPLIELFSLYNKARGKTDLVSPGDVLAACRAMEKQSYSQYTLKQLSSGRLALQHKNISLVLDKLVPLLGPQLCNPKEKSKGEDVNEKSNISTTTVFPQSWMALKSVNELQFAAKLHVARSVALDLLQELELHGYLCRSGGEHGCVAFHWNIFIF
ncbi:Snf8/Vps36 family [Trypanosoma melophagium]|uniref:Snf8/Vps36 family n=1 Tax=Trypanosoma melophagium TaxID=715481 RepID=UPI00351AA583|nr:Snf8/Vps36 family [Trypanosoma melophagium]